MISHSIDFRACNRRVGFTLVELCVVVGIIGMLASFLLPAVQSSREAARRIQCANHQRQMILACHSFASDRGGFPTGYYRSYSPTGVPDPMNGAYSLHCILLPYLEQGSLYNSINFKLPTLDSPFEPVQLTAAIQQVQVFLCPSDPFHRTRPYATHSYRGCEGLGASHLAGSSFENPGQGIFWSTDWGRDQTLPLASIRDGLANTLALSEKVVGAGNGGSYQPFRDWTLIKWIETDFSADRWRSICRDLRETTLIDRKRDGGNTWMVPGSYLTGFTVADSPNTAIPDCGRTELGGIFSARSYHLGGVNSALADGSVRWFRSSVNLAVWRALGTRSGGDIQSEF